jgi:hypothetical protein
MKNKLIAFIFLAIALSSSVLFITSCDIKSPVEGLEVRLTNITRNTFVNVKFYNATDNSQITEEVTIRFEGPGKSNVISSSNEAVAQIKSFNGNAIFSIKDDINPSQDNPVELNLVCSANGYIQTTKSIDVVQNGTSYFKVFLVNPGAAPRGVVSNSESSGSSSSGGTSQDINVSSGVEASSGSSVSVSLPSGTRLIGSDGSVLTGNVTTRVTYFNPVDQQSITSFPGGLTGVTVAQQSGQEEDGSFITAGFVAIDMDVNGNPVERFENGTLDIDWGIPASLTNPETGLPIQAGDVVPLWSLDEDTGEWKNEGSVSVQAGRGTGNVLRAKATGLTHLSYWNLDWFYTTYCRYGSRLSFNLGGGCLPNEIEGFVYFEESPGSGTFERWGHYFYANTNDPIVGFQYAANDRAARVVVGTGIDWWTSTVTGVLYDNVFTNLCIDETFNVTFTNLPNNLQEVTITVNITCDSQDDNPRVIVPNGYPVQARKVDANGNPIGNWFSVGNFVNGSVVECLEVGATYEFMMEYDGNWYETRESDVESERFLLIDGTQITIDFIDDERICDEL